MQPGYVPSASAGKSEEKSHSPHFVLKRIVQFADTDLAAVLHFSNYYRYMEETECAFWRSIGPGVIIPTEDGYLSWPRVASSCEYFSPARFQDEIEIAMTLIHLGERSVTNEFEFTREGKRIALGRTTAVCCATSDGTFQSIVIPVDLRKKLEDSRKPR